MLLLSTDTEEITVDIMSKTSMDSVTEISPEVGKLTS